METNSKITGSTFVLAVKNLEKSVDYYLNKLGFETVWTDDGWHTVRREKFSIMLGECPDDRSAFETKNHSYFAYIDVENIDKLYEEYQSKDIDMRPIGDKPWGQREFAITTIDGHRITFGGEIKEPPES